MYPDIVSCYFLEAGHDVPRRYEAAALNGRCTPPAQLIARWFTRGRLCPGMHLRYQEPYCEVVAL